MQSLPAETREFLAGGIRAEMEQFDEIEKDSAFIDPGKRNESVSNQFIQDLYRFYKIFPGKSGFEDVFSWKFDFHNTIALGGILRDDPKILRKIAEHFFSGNYYDEALEIYNTLLFVDENGEIYQKIAYCHQQNGDFKKALNAYLKAELYGLNPVWNQKKIALCYRNLKKPAKALEYYLLAEKSDPENLNTLLSVGHCHLELKEFDKALKYYFKVEYLSPENKKVWRPIAWCSFLAGKIEQSLKYYERILKEGAEKHDFINMGHVQWKLENRKQAIDYYKNSVQMKNGFSEAEFFDVFNEDKPYLVENGIDPEEIPIMLDLIRYSVSSE
jgi:tetratricopeptide (TPR) repeat protein